MVDREMPCRLFEDWHVVARTQDCPPGTVKSLRLLGRDLVLWNGDGQFSVAEDRCPHRGAKLSRGQVQENTLICPYHGLAYDLRGQCVRVPAHPTLSPPGPMRLSTYLVQERYGLVWVCAGKGEEPIPPFIEWDDSSYRKLLCGPYRYRASALRAMENFLDLSHFPFVHDGLLGDRHHPIVEDYQVETRDSGIALNNARVWQPDPDGTGTGGLVTYSFQVWRPPIASFTKEAPSGRFAIFFAVTPVEEDECLGWMWIAMNYGHDLAESELRQFQDRVVQQDIPIVESQQPTRLPLNLQAEVHLHGDRVSIAYRQWLQQQGVKFGTVGADERSPSRFER